MGMSEPDHPSQDFSPGAQAEMLVAQYLKDRGFDLVALNLRVGRDELDVVARHRDLVVIVEVRFRSARSWTTGFGSILPDKRKRLQRAARRLWRTRYAHDPTVSRLRLDAAAVVFNDGRYVITYCPGALPGL
jgi:putative endonuclease